MAVKRELEIRFGALVMDSTFCPDGSSDSPCIDTQPRFIPPAFSEWMAKSDFASRGWAKNSRDCECQ